MISLSSAVAVGDAFLTRINVYRTPADSNLMAGVILADGVVSGSGKQIAAMPYGWGGSWVNISAFTNYQNNVDYNQGGDPYLEAKMMWLRLVRLANNGSGVPVWRIDLSPNGIHWLTSYTLAYDVVPTHVGLFCSSWNSDRRSILTFDTLRKQTGIT
jgi:hypothetical protein